MTKSTAYASLAVFSRRHTNAAILDDAKASFLALDALHDELVVFSGRLPAMTSFDHINGMRSPTSKCVDLQDAVNDSIRNVLGELDMGWAEAVEFFSGQ